MSKAKKKQSRSDINAKKIVDNLIKTIEENDILPWQANFTLKDMININSGNAYSGYNKGRLFFEHFVQGYESSLWGTFNQWKEKKRFPKKGEKATWLQFYMSKWYHSEKDEWVSLNKMDKEEAKKKGYKRRNIINRFCVFNLDQTDGDTLSNDDQGKESEEIDVQPIPEIETFIRDFKNHPEIKTGGFQPIYKIKHHSVQVPSLEAYQEKAIKRGIEEHVHSFYYADMFHELIHSTGHKSCLARFTLESFQKETKEKYSYEELIAEIGSCFLRSQFDLVNEHVHKNSAAYIKGWVKYLKDHPRAILSASAEAEKATDWINGVYPS